MVMDDDDYDDHDDHVYAKERSKCRYLRSGSAAAPAGRY